MKLFGFLPILGFACALAGSLASAAERTFFAFDDVSIPWQHNLKVTLLPAIKHPGNPVLRRGPLGAPDHGHAILYGTVIKEGAKFRMWYLGMIHGEVQGPVPKHWRPMCYAESTDGIHWTKPELGLVDFNGGTKNNICRIEGEPFSLTRVNDFLSVMLDSADPDPARRYKAAYIAHVPYDDIPGGMSQIGVKERLVCAFVTATSPDGLRWKVVGDRPVNAGGERFEVTSLYRFGDFYYSAGQLIPPWTWRTDGSDARVEGGANAGRVMLTYRSPDFKSWSRAKALAFARPGQLANPPARGQQTHMGAGVWNRGNVLVGLHGLWQDADTPPPKGAAHLTGVHIDLGLVLSNDGVRFREPVPGFAVIPRGRAGEWDDIALLQGHAFVNEGDRTLIWYSHWDTGAGLKDMEIGLATLRRDGFGYLSRQEEDNDAHFVTSPFTASSVSANVEGLTPEAPLVFQLLDHLDQPVEGYTATLTENGLHQEIKWPRPLSVGRPIALRVTFPLNSRAKLYALYLND